ncbi:MAG: UDP-N-acetylmuramoyl-L-alanine--D-glutamate ligase [Candidatus Actinomarina sp.]
MKTLIFGYGVTGKAVEKFLKNKSKEYLIYDDNEDVLIDVKKEFLFNNSQIDKIDEIVISPGINPRHDKFKKLNAKKKIITDIDLFSKEFEGKFIGVTGTNGKTTFVNLLSEFMNTKGFNAVACGNVGVSPLNINFTENDYAIVELSSFQLYYASNLEIDIGVFLNFHSDHLDWHKDEEEYKKSKLKLVSFLNSNDNLVTGFNTFSETHLENVLDIHIDKNKDDLLMSTYNFDNTSYPIDTCLSFLKILEKLDINLNEGYEYLKKEMNSEHRFEFVDSINGTKFINDSKATNFHSMSVATSKVKSALLIMHGVTKNIPHDGIHISNEVKKIIIPNNMNIDMKIPNCEILKIDSILNLESYLAEEYQNFETILFSCGGASFSDFKDYKDRGTFFRKLVRNLKENEK